MQSQHSLSLIITTGYTQAAVTWTSQSTNHFQFISTPRLNVRLSDPFRKHNITISRAPHFAKMRWVWVVQNDLWMTPWYSYSPGIVGKSKLPKNHMTINDILHWYPLVFFVNLSKNNKQHMVENSSSSRFFCGHLLCPQITDDGAFMETTHCGWMGSVPVSWLLFATPSNCLLRILF